MAWRLDEINPGKLRNSGIATLKQSENTSNLFYFSQSGRLQHVFYKDGSRSQSEISHPRLASQHGAGVAAICRRGMTDHAEVFWVSPDGSIDACYKYGNDNWQFYTMIGSNNTAIPGSPVTAISRHENSMDVFWVGNDGSVHGANYASKKGVGPFPLS